MLHRPAPATSYLTETGAINMRHVMREAHRRTRNVLANWSHPSLPRPTYAAEFREKLISELGTAKIKRAAFLDEQRGTFPNLVTTTSQFGGMTFHDQSVAGSRVNVFTY